MWLAHATRIFHIIILCTLNEMNYYSIITRQFVRVIIIDVGLLWCNFLITPTPCRSLCVIFPFLQVIFSNYFYFPVIPVALPSDEIDLL